MQLPPDQAQVLEGIVARCGLPAVLGTLSAFCRRTAGGFGEDDALGARWDGFADRIDEMASGILDVIDGGRGRWGTPSWKRLRGEDL